MVEEDAGAGFVLREIFCAFCKEPGIPLVQDKTVAGECNGGRNQSRTRARAIPRHRKFKPGDRPRNADRLVSARAEARDDGTFGVLVKRSPGGSRCGFAKIDECFAPVSQPQGHETTAAKVARFGEGPT